MNEMIKELRRAMSVYFGMHQTKTYLDACKTIDKIVAKHTTELLGTPMHFTKKQKAWINQFVIMRCEIAREQERANKEKCQWKEENGVDYYYTCGCKSIWYQESDKLEWKYCPYCGKEIELRSKE